MAVESSPDLTVLLRAWAAGDKAALDRLAPMVYSHLRRIAARYMKNENSGQTLQPTALVNEAYVRLLEGTKVEWNDRAHFFAVAAQLMRRILVDIARSRTSVKRGGRDERVYLADPATSIEAGKDVELLSLNWALDRLAAIDPRKVQVIEMRFFAGLSVEETAAVLQVSPQTVLRDWSLAKAWLAREMASSGSE